MPGKMARSGPQRHLDGPGGPEGAVHTPIRASKQSGNRYNARRFGVHLGNTGSKTTSQILSSHSCMVGVMTRASEIRMFVMLDITAHT